MKFPSRGLLLKYLFLALLGAAGIGILCAPILGRQFILPGLAQADPAAVLRPSPLHELVELALPDGTRLVGQFGKPYGMPQGDPSAPTVLFFYGSSQTLAAPSDQRVFRSLQDMGFNVFIPEFPGYGMSAGVPSERGFFETAEVCLDYLKTRSDVDPSRVFVAGRSLGTATAVDLASRREVAGLICVGGFTTAAEVLENALAWMPRWLAESATSECRFDSLAKMKSVRCPVLLVFGGRDDLVPPRMSDALGAAAAGPVTRHCIEHAQHNDLWRSEHHGLDTTVREWVLAQSASKP